MGSLKSTEQGECGVGMGVRFCPPHPPVVLNTPHSTPISRHGTEQEGEFQATARSLLF